MKLSIKDGSFYADNLFLCYVEVRDGSDSLQPGHYAAETRYSHHHRQDLPYVDGVGWIGPANNRDESPCAIVLGRIRGRAGIVECPSFVVRLLALLATAEDRGESVSVVVE